MKFAKSAKDILKYRHHRKWVRFARNRALDVLGMLQKLDSSPRLLFLSFHFLFENEKDNFRQILETLLSQFTIVSYSQAVELWKSKEIDKPYLCFSCDDGFDNYFDAATIMREYEISGCVFVCPSMVGMTDKSKITLFNKERLKGPPIGFMDWDQLKQLKSMGHEIGNHTFDHLNLGELSVDQIQNQIGKAHESLIQNLGHVNHFAWPYGKPATIQKEAIDFAYSLGYKSVASTVRGAYYKEVEENLPYIKRHNFEPFWPMNHINYFLNSPRYQ